MTTEDIIKALEPVLVKFFPAIGGLSTAQLVTVMAVVEPIAKSFIEAVAAADAQTKAEGWHWVIPIPGDPEHPDGRPYITKEDK